MIDKESFVDTINFLEVLIKKNKKDGDTVLLIRKVFTLLFLLFPDKKVAKFEIEHYCFYTNFGKPSPESEYVTPEELYERLI